MNLHTSDELDNCVLNLKGGEGVAIYLKYRCTIFYTEYGRGEYEMTNPDYYFLKQIFVLILVTKARSSDPLKGVHRVEAHSRRSWRLVVLIMSYVGNAFIFVRLADILDTLVILLISCTALSLADIWGLYKTPFFTL